MHLSRVSHDAFDTFHANRNIVTVAMMLQINPHVLHLNCGSVSWQSIRKLLNSSGELRNPLWIYHTRLWVGSAADWQFA